MAGHGAHITAMVRSHASGDEDAFYSVALQVAAREARQGHHRLASDIKKAVDSSRQRARSPLATVATLPRPEGDIAGLVEISQPRVRLRDLVISPELGEQITQVIQEQRQRSVLLEHGFTPMHRLLLEGPPGTGKTMTASVIASELSLPMYTVRLDTLLSKFMGETASKLRAVFDEVAACRAAHPQLVPGVPGGREPGVNRDCGHQPSLYPGSRTLPSLRRRSHLLTAEWEASPVGHP